MATLLASTPGTLLKASTPDAFPRTPSRLSSRINFVASTSETYTTAINRIKTKKEFSLRTQQGNPAAENWSFEQRIHESLHVLKLMEAQARSFSSPHPLSPLALYKLGFQKGSSVETLDFMAADVSSLVRVLNSCKEEQVNTESNGAGKVLITRDLLGSCSSQLGSKELDLDLQVPYGWEKRLDMKSGKLYLQKCSSPLPEKKIMTSSHQELQELNLNFPPSSSSSKTEEHHESPDLRNNFPEDNLDLKLVPPIPASPTSFDYQSVCTLEKVKSALQRAGRESNKRTLNFTESSSTNSLSPSSSSSSLKEKSHQASEESSCPPGLLFAAACPSCLLYVLISRMNPKCPRCDSFVPYPTLKKARLDLNTAL